MNNNFNNYCLRVFSKVKPNSTFLSINKYKNNFDEVANFSVVFHVNYLNTVMKAQNIIQELSFTRDMPYSINVLKLAQDELLNSFQMTLNGFNPLYTCHNVYSDILDHNGKPIPGIKLHLLDNVLHLNALCIRKKIIIPGLYPKVNSEEKTLAKRYLKNLTPLSKWVQFKLKDGRFSKLVVEKMLIKGNFNEQR